MGGNLEGKSEEVILKYEDFCNLKKGDYLVLSMDLPSANERGVKMYFRGTTTFFEKQILEGNKQKVYLRHFERTSSILYDGKKPRVVKYILPLEGKLELKIFQEGEVKPKPKNNLKRKL